MALQTIPTFTSFNNAVVFGQSEFKAGKMTDLNSVYSWYGKDTFTNYKGMISLWNQFRLMNTPLLRMTELQNSVMSVNGAEGKFRFSMQYDMTLPYIQENLVGDIEKPGIDGQRFKIKLNENCYTNTDIITYDPRDGKQLFVTEEEIYQEDDGWIYTVELVTFDHKNDYFPQKFLAPGTQFMKIENANGEYSTQKSSITSRTGLLHLESQLGGARSVYHWITGYANMLNIVDAQGGAVYPGISQQYGNMGVSNFALTFANYDTQNRTVLKKSTKWMPMVEALLWAEIKQMEEYGLMWAKGGTVSGAGRRKTRVGLGLYEQLRNGYRYKYSVLTRGLIEQAIGNLFYNTGIPVEDRKVKLQCGFGAFTELLKLFAAQLVNLPFLLNGSELGAVTGSGTNLSVGYMVKRILLPVAGWIEIEHNPAFDAQFTRAADGLIGEFPKQSYTIAILDVTDENKINVTSKMKSKAEGQVRYEPGFNSGSNIVLVKPEGFETPSWGYEIGTSVPPGWDRTRIVGSSQRDGYAMWIKQFSNIWVKDVTKTLLIEKE